MTQERRTLMLCACEFWCADPYISGEDALEDARQVVSMMEEKGLFDQEAGQTILRVTCRILSMDRAMSPQEALGRALWLYDATGKEADQ